MPPPEHERKSHAEGGHVPLEEQAAQGAGTYKANVAAAQKVIDYETSLTPILQDAAIDIDKCLDAGAAEEAVGAMALTFYYVNRWDPRIVTPSRVARLVALLQRQKVETFTIGLDSLGMLAGYGGGIPAIRSVVADALQRASFPFLKAVLQWDPAAWQGLARDPKILSAARQALERNHGPLANDYLLLRAAMDNHLLTPGGVADVLQHAPLPVVQDAVLSWDPAVWKSLAKDPKGALAVRHAFVSLAGEPVYLRVAMDEKIISQAQATAYFRAYWMPNGRLDKLTRDPQMLDFAVQNHFVSNQELKPIGAQVYGLKIGAPHSMGERISGWAAAAKEAVGLGEAPGHVADQEAGATTVAAMMLPKNHLALLQHVEVVNSKLGKNLAGDYDVSHDKIDLSSTATAGDVLHELGHALDARMGYPSVQPNLFGWHVLHNADALAAAVGLDTLDPRAARMFHACYERLYAGERNWKQLFLKQAKSHGIDVAAWIHHPAYLAGSGADPTSDVGIAKEALDSPGHNGLVAFFHGRYGTGYALVKVASQAYANAFYDEGYVRYAPGECFATIYERWYSDKDRSWANKIPKPAKAFFEHEVETFKGPGHVPKVS